MVLAETLHEALLPVFDLATARDRADFPRTPAQVAAFWAQAVQVWLTPLVPLVQYPQLRMAVGLFQAELLLSLTARNPRALELAFVALGPALALGMAPAFAATPPPGEPAFAPVYALGLSGGSSLACLRVLVEQATAWLRLGRAVPTAGGPAVPWS